MSRSVAIVCALAVGWLVGLQPAANALMARHVSNLGAAFVSVAISAVVVSLLLVVFGHPGRLAGLSHFRPEWVLGGVGGAAVVTVGIVVIRPLGAAAVVALLVAAQLVGSVMVDRFGWFGVHHVGIGLGRIVGVLLVVTGTFLITRG